MYYLICLKSPQPRYQIKLLYKHGNYLHLGNTFLFEHIILPIENLTRLLGVQIEIYFCQQYPGRMGGEHTNKNINCTKSKLV